MERFLSDCFCSLSADDASLCDYFSLVTVEVTVSCNTWSTSALQYVFDLCNGDIANACKCMLSGSSFESLVSLLSSAVLTNEEECALK